MSLFSSPLSHSVEFVYVLFNDNHAAILVYLGIYNLELCALSSLFI